MTDIRTTQEVHDAEVTQASKAWDGEEPWPGDNVLGAWR